MTMDRYPRRTLLGGALALPSLGDARAAEWPDHPVRIIVPNPPGGSSDVLTRIIAAELSLRFGQPFLIENRAGAGGNIGLDLAAHAAPDGYTLAAATVSQWVINNFLYRRMSYDPRNDFAYVALMWEMANVLVVPARVLPTGGVAEFIAWARPRADPLVFSSPGIGTSAHLLGELFGLRTRLPVLHLPFRGVHESAPAMLRGDVQFSIDNLASWRPLVEGGDVRALAITAEERSPLLPEVPTMLELGLPEFVVTVWAGFVAPAGTPRPIIRALSGVLQQIGRDAEVAARFAAAGARLRGSTPEEMLARADRERPLWGELVRVSGARAE